MVGRVSDKEAEGKQTIACWKLFYVIYIKRPQYPCVCMWVRLSRWTKVVKIQNDRVGTNEQLGNKPTGVKL